jgi:hypothetical protein
MSFEPPISAHYIELKDRIDTLISSSSTKSLKDVFTKLKAEVEEHKHFDVWLMLVEIEKYLKQNPNS